MDNNPHRSDEHPLSEKQTNTESQKVSTTIAALTDPKFPLPSLEEETSVLRHVLSFGTLFAMLGLGLACAWYLDIEILQSSQPAAVLSSAFVIVVGALFLTGTVWIDWYELVLGYWWLSMPIGALAGLVLVLNQEASAGIEETS